MIDTYAKNIQTLSKIQRSRDNEYPPEGPCDRCDGDCENCACQPIEESYHDL